MSRKKARLAQGLLVAFVTAALVVGTVYLLEDSDGIPSAPREAEAPTPATPKDGAAIREELLHGSAEKLGITPVGGVWGVLMERGYTKGVATFVALADGTASMYLSTGGAVVGGRLYGPARLAALKLCAQAAQSLADTTPADKFPPPGKGRVRFYVLTKDGARMAEGDLLPGLADAGRVTEGQTALLEAGAALVAALQEATSKGVVR